MKKCGYCGLENQDAVLECAQCARDEFLIQNVEGKMVKEPPRLVRSATDSRIGCQFRLREIVPGSPSQYKTVASTWGGLKRGFIAVDDGHVVLEQRLGLVAALLIGFLTFIVGILIFGVCIAILSFIIHSTSQNEGSVSPAVNLVWIFVIGVPLAYAWWTRRFHRKYGFDEVIGGLTLDSRLVLDLRRKPIVPPLGMDTQGDGTAVRPDGELALKFPQTDDLQWLIQRLSAAGVKVDDSTAQVKQAISSFVERLKAATPHDWVASVLVSVNVALFVILTALNTVQNSGISLTASFLTKWGADYGPLTINDNQWWRLLTSCFLHANILHLLFNMYALILVGKLTERLFGNWFFLLIYLGCGITASLTSLWIHPSITSVGASGAIFGLYGALVGYLLREHSGLPRIVAGPILQSAAVFIAFNLFYGFIYNAEGSVIGNTAHIDLSAHCGGLLSGLVFGFLGARPLELEQRQAATYNRGVALASAIGVLVILMFILAIHL